MSSIKAYLLELNLFQSNDGTIQDAHEHHSNKISTRIYLVLLIVLIIGFTIGLFVISQTKISTLKNPSQDQFEALTATDANCPCSRISLVYEDFITLEASIHQVCSSDFVSDRWIRTIFTGLNTTNFYQGDFRTIGSAQFQALAALCRLSEENIQHNLASFLATSFISPQALSRTFLESKVQTLIEQFQQTVHIAFQSQLQLVNRMIYANQFFPGLRTNTLLLYTFAQTTQVQALYNYRLVYNQVDGSQCACFDGYDCVSPSGIYDEFGFWAYFSVAEQGALPLMTIPGLFSGCMPMDSLLLSSLECFYNQTCLNEILLMLSLDNNFTAISVIEQSIFQPNTTIQSIVNHTMVENWARTISFEKYFLQCAPNSCTFLVEERNGVLFVLTKIIGLLGGFILILKLIVPQVVRHIRNRKLKRNQSIPSPRIPLSARWKQLKMSLKRFLIELNLFQTPSLDDRHIRYQRIGTRFYLFILLLAIMIITLNSSLTTEIRSETVLNPTEFQYHHLQQTQYESLVCSCSLISMSHEMFISITPIYHQVCSSDYISPAWIAYLNQIQVSLSTIPFEYQINIGVQFTLLRVFCESIQQTIDDALRTFLQTQFVSSVVVTPDIFTSQVQSLVDNWQLNTINRYQYVIQLLRAIYQGNLLMSDRFNSKLQVSSESREATLRPFQYPNCSCALSGLCIAPFSLYTCYVYSNGSDACLEDFRIPNFYTGCFPMEALFQSTLECFYNRNCTDSVQTYVNGKGITTEINISILVTTEQWPNESIQTVESIVNRLMVNTWEKNISFTSYYQACAPISCTFEYMGRPHILFVITMIVGVFGGLSTALKILISIIVRSVEEFAEGNFRLGLIQFIKRIFIRHDEQQIARRIHVVLVVVTLSVLYLTTFLIPQVTTVHITQPSLSMYQTLSEKFSDSLQCPCSKISFKYNLFLTVEPQFHEICSSEFTSYNWTLYINNGMNPFIRFDRTDFRATAIGQYQLLASLCQLSQKTINNALSQLLESDYIDAQLTSSNVLEKRIQGIIDEFQVRTPRTFVNTFNLIRETIAANMLMSVYTTNWKFKNLDITRGQYQDGFLETLPLDYEGCSCGLSSRCTQPSRGMMAGCYPLEALLQSTFECFYDQLCIDSNHVFQALTASSVRSRFDINATIESVFQVLMVEDYFIYMSYENYFAQCAPSQCTYSYSTHRRAIDIVTSLLELYSGLVIICLWITVLIMKLYRCRIRRINPQT